jgi:hypothetical protein
VARRQAIIGCREPELDLKTSTKIILCLIAAIALAAAIYFFLPPIYASFTEIHHADEFELPPPPDATESNVNPLATGVLLLMVVLTWTLPRRLAFCPLLVLACLMPLGQQLVLFGFHFPLFRLLLLAGALRVIVKGESSGLKWTRVDTLFVCWLLVSLFVGTMSEMTTDHFQTRLGEVYNATFCYFFVRCVVLDLDDIAVGVRTLAWMSLPVAALMLVEANTAHNLLSVFGGVPDITTVREGHLRCQGAFGHPILAGTFGATQIPLFAGLWFYRPSDRPLAVAAAVSAVIIALTASSSGAFLAILAAISGLALWKARKCLRPIRWGMLVAVVCWPLVMHAPIWHLMGILSGNLGGEGWYRAHLIDEAIAHFRDWCTVGTVYTADWGLQVTPQNPAMVDLVNQYVAEAVNGGALKLGMFIIIIISCFKGLGRALRDKTPTSAVGFFIWTMGVSLFTHCFSFLSISYFDQTIVVWFWLLASISCLVSIHTARPVSPVAKEPSWDRALSHS